VKGEGEKRRQGVGSEDSSIDFETTSEEGAREGSTERLE